MSPLFMKYLIWPLVKFLVAFLIVQVIVMLMNWIERRTLGLMQARLGPNRVGYKGILQIIADPLKFILKEDIVPSSSEKVAYFLGPMLPLIPAFLVFCLIPFGPPPTFIAARVNVALLLILALTSTGVYGIILGGGASHNKYSLLGGPRSAAQIVSYEVPFGLSIVGVLMLCGSFDLVHIVRYQETNAWNFLPPIVACFIFLVAGYHTEYSAMKFAFFMLAEYSAMLVNCCLMVSLFFGGWTLAMGGVGLTTDVLRSWGLFGGILGCVIFTTKVMAFMMVYIWFRATFPRFRFDQLMDLGWKWMIPLALGNIFVTGIIVLAGQERLLYWVGGAVIVLTAFYVFRPRPKVVHASRASEP